MKTLNTQSIAAVAGAGITATLQNADWKHAAIVGATTAAISAAAGYVTSKGLMNHTTVVPSAVVIGLSAALATVLVPSFESAITFDSSVSI